MTSSTAPTIEELEKMIDAVRLARRMAEEIDQRIREAEYYGLQESYLEELHQHRNEAAAEVEEKAETITRLFRPDQVECHTCGATHPRTEMLNSMSCSEACADQLEEWEGGAA